MTSAAARNRGALQLVSMYRDIPKPNRNAAAQNRTGIEAVSGLVMRAACHKPNLKSSGGNTKAAQ